MINEKNYANMGEDHLNKKFLLACLKDYFDVVRFLVFDMNIEKTKLISDFVDGDYHEISRWFQVGDLNYKISKNLLQF